MNGHNQSAGARGRERTAAPFITSLRFGSAATAPGASMSTKLARGACVAQKRSTMSGPRNAFVGTDGMAPANADARQVAMTVDHATKYYKTQSGAVHKTT